VNTCHGAGQQSRQDPVADATRRCATADQQLVDDQEVELLVVLLCSGLHDAVHDPQGEV
jgi:hypothetical protein